MLFSKLSGIEHKMYWNGRSIAILTSNELTHFMPLNFFFTRWKHQKTRGFWMSPEGVEKDKRHETDWEKTKFDACMQIWYLYICAMCFPLVSRKYWNWNKLFSFNAESIQVWFFTFQLTQISSKYQKFDRVLK